jgi:hypothetical protein
MVVSTSLGACDAVAAWIRHAGLDIAGPPREVYFVPDFAGAGAQDEVCDVAFPAMEPD